MKERLKIIGKVLFEYLQITLVCAILVLIGSIFGILFGKIAYVIVFDIFMLALVISDCVRTVKRKQKKESKYDIILTRSPNNKVNLLVNGEFVKGLKAIDLHIDDGCTILKADQMENGEVKHRVLFEEIE